LTSRRENGIINYKIKQNKTKGMLKMTRAEIEVEKRVLLVGYESTVYAMLQNSKVLGLPDYMIEDLEKLRKQTEEIRKIEKLGN